MSYYFAYGSNLNVNQIQQRCPSVKFIRTATLSKYKLVFDRFASIEYTGNTQDIVYGVIYYLSDIDEAMLDRYEGVAANVYKKEYITFSIYNEKQKVVTYIRNNVEYNAPDSYYLNKIKSGYSFFGFPLNILSKIKTKEYKKMITKSDNNTDSNNYYFYHNKSKEYKPVDLNTSYNKISNIKRESYDYYNKTGYLMK